MALKRSSDSSRVGVPGSGFAVVSLLSRALVLTVALLSHAAVPSASAALPPGSMPCLTNDVPAGYGTFVMIKGASYRQPVDGAPAEATAPSSAALIELTSPAAFAYSNAVVSVPGGGLLSLVDQGGGRSLWTNSYPAETNLNATLPAGAWNTAFDVVLTNGDAFVGFFPFTVASSVPPVAAIADLATAQAIAPGAPFTLTWTPWLGSSTNDRISLAIADAGGRVVVSAATDCGGEFLLPTSATSFEIPAGRLAAGSSYTGHLTFTSPLFHARDDSALLFQRGFQARTTSFPLRTSGSSGGEPATLANLRISGTNLVFAITGTPGGTYLVQSSRDFAAWTEETQVVLPASGTAEVTLPLPTDGTPRFYRAIATGGGGTPADPAQLTVALEGPRTLRLTLQGTSGATYTIQSTTNYQSWIPVQEVTVPAGATQVTVSVPVPLEATLFVLRAVAASGPPPPTGLSPNLSISRDGLSVRIQATNGDPNRTYVIQSTPAGWPGWTDTTVSLTTDATGAGSALIPVNPAEPAAFFRAVAP